MQESDKKERQRKYAEQRRRRNGVAQYKGISDTCCVCQKIYTRAGKNSKTCGQECSKELARNRSREQQQKKRRDSGVEALGGLLNCANCGAEFVRHAVKIKYCAPCRELQKKNALPAMKKYCATYKLVWHKNKMTSDPVYACERIIRGSICNSISRMGYTKRNRCAEILGCTWAEFKSHLERQFLDGMTWENRGQWHIDHILPISSAKTEADVIALNHFTNLRPLWARDNIAKSGKAEFLI